jgi:hypothetical protein
MSLSPRPRVLTSGPEEMLVLSISDDYDVVVARNSEELPNLMDFMLSGTHILTRRNQSDNYLLE